MSVNYLLTGIEPGLPEDKSENSESEVLYTKLIGEKIQ